MATRRSEPEINVYAARTAAGMTQAAFETFAFIAANRDRTEFHIMEHKSDQSTSCGPPLPHVLVPIPVMILTIRVGSI